MFNSTLLPCEKDRKRLTSGANSICSEAATSNITVTDIHLGLQNIILQYCSSTRKALDKLLELQHLFFNHVKKARMSYADFINFISEAENAILDIAIVCGMEHHFRQSLQDLRDKPVDNRMICQDEKITVIICSIVIDLKTEAISDLLCHGTFPKILRNSIPTNITPKLICTLCENSKCSLNASEKLQITTLKTSYSYDSCDASFLYKLIRNSNCLQPPTQGWGKIPTKKDTSLSDDIERIHMLRNKLAHRHNTRVDQNEFETYFMEFHKITQRISEDYEKELTSIETSSLDPNRQNDLTKALMALEDVKGEETIQIQIELTTVDDAESRAEILNGLKNDINKGAVNIEFIQADYGSLILYANIYSEIMKTDESLQLEISSFIRKILHHGRVNMTRTQWIDAVILLVEGSVELKTDSSAEKTLRLKFNVKMDVFETETRLEAEIGDFMQQTIGHLNGKGFTEDVTALFGTIQPDEAIHGDDAVLCKETLIRDGPQNSFSSNANLSKQTNFENKNTSVETYSAESDFNFINTPLSIPTISGGIAQMNESSNIISSLLTNHENLTACAEVAAKNDIDINSIPPEIQDLILEHSSLIRKM
ncbi:unnamed protein product [Mytilus edulis]|uniref:DZIP3-like HEPN domain-containing protein n=1 Tax=Mytilus edulis TaxID=6550 RepID=A0A8S3Q5Y6_MYTED|nr:unnamed protein product [Mytilus edulis]